MGKSVDHSLDCWLMWKSQAHFKECYYGAGSPERDKKDTYLNMSLKAISISCSPPCVLFLLQFLPCLSSHYDFPHWITVIRIFKLNKCFPRPSCFRSRCLSQQLKTKATEKMKSYLKALKRKSIYFACKFQTCICLVISVHMGGSSCYSDYQWSLSL